MRLGRATAAAAAVLVCAALLVPTAGAGAAPRYAVGSAARGYAELLAHPTALPPGMNVWSCRPSPAHPQPVVLLPGTLWTLISSFDVLAPVLADDGYCVFGLNYGPSALTTETGGRVYAAGDLVAAAHQLAAFVDRVRAATHADKVDIVGWSQGGMMPRYYLRYLGGASSVARLVGLASSSHGTTVDGANALLDAAAMALGIRPFTLIGCLACTQQILPSPVMTAVNAGGDTVPGVRYTVIETKYDEVVTPYQTAFLSGPDVHNVLLQQQCPLDGSDHLALPFDRVAIQDVVNALGADDPAFRPHCELSLPLIGTP
jgi:pimeloyl-ACP methyl ester carboxylesterase